MTLVTQRYVRKPLYVDAVQVTEENMEEIARWSQGDVRLEVDGRKYVHVLVNAPRSLRQTKAFAGDWLLHTERGYKIYTSLSFEASFEADSGT